MELIDPSGNTNNHIGGSMHFPLIKIDRAAHTGTFRDRFGTFRFANATGSVRVVELWAFGRRFLAVFG